MEDEFEKIVLVLNNNAGEVVLYFRPFSSQFKMDQAFI